MQLLAAAAMEAPAGADARDAEGREVRGVPLDGRRGSGALRPRPVRRLPGHRRRRGGLDDRDLRGAAAGDRQLALGRRAVAHPHRQAPAGHADRAAARVPPPAAARVHPERGRRPPGDEPARDQARPDHRRPADRRRAPRRPRRPARDHARHGVRRGGRRGPDALRGPAARRDAGRQRAVHAPGQRRGDVADHAPADRAAAAGAPVRARHVGPEGGRAALAWITTGTARGCKS